MSQQASRPCCLEALACPRATLRSQGQPFHTHSLYRKFLMYKAPPTVLMALSTVFYGCPCGRPPARATKPPPINIVKTSTQSIALILFDHALLNSGLERVA